MPWSRLASTALPRPVRFFPDFIAQDRVRQQLGFFLFTRQQRDQKDEISGINITDRMHHSSPFT